MMPWASAAGIDMAECSLTSLSRISELPERPVPTTGNALIVKRFGWNSVDGKGAAEDLESVAERVPARRGECAGMLEKARGR